MAFNSAPAEPGYVMLLQIVKIQIILPTDLDLLCLSFSMRIYINNPDLDQIHLISN